MEQSQHGWSHGLQSLTTLNLSNNHISSTFFDNEFQLPSLTLLSISFNKLEIIPLSIFNCKYIPLFFSKPKNFDKKKKKKKKKNK